jgi:hypothetical protein
MSCHPGQCLVSATGCSRRGCAGAAPHARHEGFRATSASRTITARFRSMPPNSLSLKNTKSHTTMKKTANTAAAKSKMRRSVGLTSRSFTTEALSAAAAELCTPPSAENTRSPVVPCCRIITAKEKTSSDTSASASVRFSSGDTSGL